MDEEARIGSDYVVNVVMHTDFSDAGLEDDLNKTIDYVAVNRIVQEEMAIRAKLIETVGMRIASRFRYSFKTISGGEVEIVKLSPPMGGHVDSVSVSIEL